MKRVFIFAVVILTLFSCVIAKAAPSLIPFNRDWTTTEVRALIEAGADIHARTGKGGNPIIGEIEFRRHSRWVKTLLEQGGLTPLMLASALSADPEVIQVLLAAGAKTNARNESGMTPLLFVACVNESPKASEMINTLIEAGADVDAREEKGSTPLIHAAWRNSPEVVKALIAAGAKVNARTGAGLTPLMYAAGYSDNPKVVKILLNAGADGRPKSYEGKTAFDYAKGNPAVRDTDVYWLLSEARF